MTPDPVRMPTRGVLDALTPLHCSHFETALNIGNTDISSCNLSGSEVTGLDVACPMRDVAYVDDDSCLEPSLHAGWGFTRVMPKSAA